MILEIPKRAFGTSLFIQASGNAFYGRRFRFQKFQSSHSDMGAVAVANFSGVVAGECGIQSGNVDA